MIYSKKTRLLEKGGLHMIVFAEQSAEIKFNRNNAIYSQTFDYISPPSKGILKCYYQQEYVLHDGVKIYRLRDKLLKNGEETVC